MSFALSLSKGSISSNGMLRQAQHERKSEIIYCSVNSEVPMPYVNIKVTRDGVTPEQKRQLISGVTDLLVKVLNKNPQTTMVVIDEVDTDNWGIGGESVTDRRKKS